MEDFIAIAEKLSGAGLATLLVFILIGGQKKIWVWGYQLEEMRAERDWWRTTASRATSFADRAVDLVTPKSN